METINDVVCRTVHNFLKDRINEIESNRDTMDTIEEMWKGFGYTGPKVFLSKVKHNIEDATYAFNEIMTYNMNRDYVNDYVCKNDCGSGEIYMMFDTDNHERYFYIDYSGNTMKPVELKKVKKVIEIETFEKI